ncbi:hypothetical protein ACFQX6_42150 [Streptosporangium lutulentum]
MRPQLTMDDVAEEVHRGRLVMISVHKWIRGLIACPRPGEVISSW